MERRPPHGGRASECLSSGPHGSLSAGLGDGTRAVPGTSELRPQHGPGVSSGCQASLSIRQATGLRLHQDRLSATLNDTDSAPGLAKAAGTEVYTGRYIAR